MFNFNHLFYFFTVARLGGMTKAAQHLHIAQPSLSTQIKALEAHTNRVLFKKSGRGLALTQDGEILYSICRKMFEPIDELEHFLTSMKSPLQNRIRIGVADELERPFVVNLIHRIFRSNLLKKSAHISMKSDKHRVLMEQLRAREIDVLLSNYSAYGDDFSVIAEIPMPIIAVAAPKLVKSYRKSHSREPLVRKFQQLDLRLVLPMEEQKLRVETEIYMQKARIKQEVIFESDTLSALVRATVEGLGVAFLPKPYVQKELKSGILVKLNEGQKLWNHPIYQIANKTRQADFINSAIRSYFKIYKEK